MKSIQPSYHLLGCGTKSPKSRAGLAAMKPLRRYLLLSLIFLGFVLVGRGALLWGRTDSGRVIQNWVTPALAIRGHEYMWTWGVGGIAREEPDLWHFHVDFIANGTAEVFLMWNLNQSILFLRNSSMINETFEVPLPRANGAWRWDWLIMNPHSSVLGVENFIVTHYSVRHPERQNAIVATSTGVFITVACSALVYSGRRHIPLR